MRRSAVEKLPDSLRAELDRRLVSSGFADYRDLATWLESQGYEISKSSLHRYGQKFEERLRALKLATQQARAVAETVTDDAGAMNEALIRLVQEKAFSVLVEAGPENEDLLENLPRIGRMVADLTRSSVAQKKWAQAVRAKAEAAASAVDREILKAGLSERTAEAIRAKILGIAE